MQQNRQTNAKAIASLVLSCASMICCMQWSISLVMAVLGIVFGIWDFGMTIRIRKMQQLPVSLWEWQGSSLPLSWRCC